MSDRSDHNFNVKYARQDFPILDQLLPNEKPLIYLDSASSTQKPYAVLKKERDCQRTYYANAYRGVYYFGNKIDQEMEEARKTVQNFLGAKHTHEVIFTSGTTMSINLVACAWGRKTLKAGDQILVNEMEHHANLVPWQQLAKEKKAQLVYLPLTPDGRLNCELLDDYLSDRTKLVAVTAMSNVLGTRVPIKELTEHAHRYGARVLVDAAQFAPHQTIDVQDWDVDFLAFSGHKLYGPTGVGILYGKESILESMDPFLTGGHMISEVHKDHAVWTNLPGKFEAGTLPIVQAISMSSAIEYLQKLGMDEIHEYEQQLLEHAHAELLEIPGLKIHGPSTEHKGAIVSFSVKKLHPQDLAIMLDREGICVRHGHHCAMLLHQWLGVENSTRASFGLYNTTDEINQLADGIRHAMKRFRLM